MEKREILHSIWKSIYITKGSKSVFNIYMRSGKTYLSLKILKELDLCSSKILISYPDNKILDSWLDAQNKLGISLTNVSYVNTSSIHKYSEENWDAYIFDECTDFSLAQEIEIQKIINNSKRVLALSGTISKESEQRLNNLGLDIIVKYSNQEAIKDGLISDYSIEIIKVPLNLDKNIKDKNGWISEKKKFDNYTFVINKLREERKNFMFLALNRNRILQSSQNKINKLKELIIKDERILIFTGLTKVADSLGIASYHSKSKDKTAFERFLNKEFNHLAVAKIGGSGVSYPQLDKVILSNFTYDEEDTSQIISRAMMLDYKDKVAKIIIITSNEEVELKKLNRTLQDFDKNKIKWQ